MAPELEFRHVCAGHGEAVAPLTAMIEWVANFNGNPLATSFGQKRLSG